MKLKKELYTESPCHSLPKGESDVYGARYEELTDYIRKFEKAIIAFSGGIDSYFVLKAAIDAIGKENVLAVTGDSQSLKQSEKAETRRLASNIGAQHINILTEEMENPDYTDNPVNRCFFCKDELYTKLTELKKELGYDCILDGTNFDDMTDFRPGFQASKNRGISSPLVDLKFSKSEIRQISKSLGLEIWDKPSSPCLSSRIPYGQKVTLEKLTRVEKAEEVLLALGFKDFRVRFFEINSSGNVNSGLKLAKVDISTKEIDNALSRKVVDEINMKLKEIGFDFVTLDLGGLKSGSLNIKLNTRK